MYILQEKRAKPKGKNFNMHRTNLRNSQAEGQTTLSNYVWQKRREGKEKVTSKIHLKKFLILT